nr:unnamed protein product [Callosobruchus chinensis]
MSMKRKILLGFEKMKRVYANIHHDVLLIYYSEKDSKPVGLIDLTNYTAKENPDSNSKNFDLSCDTPGQKTLHFMAPTRDEMIQWVWQINKIHDGLIEPDLESGSSDTEYDVMKEVPSTQEKSNESDELYEELETVKDKLHKSISDKPTGIIEIRPPLPGRIQLKKSPIKVSPPVVKPLPKPQLEEPVVSSNDTDAEKEDPSVSNLPESLQICSGDDEEDTYEVFAVVKNRIKGIQDAEKEITAIDQEDNPEDNYEVFTDLKKKMKDMELNRIGTEALNTNQCDENEEITPNDLAMKEQMFDGSEDKLRQTKPRIGIKPVVIKRFQVTLASDSN